jgi:hypothetical protein
MNDTPHAAPVVIQGRCKNCLAWYKTNDQGPVAIVHRMPYGLCLMGPPTPYPEFSPKGARIGQRNLYPTMGEEKFCLSFVPRSLPAGPFEVRFPKTLDDDGS